MDESAQGLDLVQIERLAERVKGLIDLLGQTRATLAEVNQENASLHHEIDALREKLKGMGAAQAAEADRLLAERDEIRERVQRMLRQIETIGASLEDQEAFSEA